MKKTVKRVLSLILCVALLVSVLSIGAFAEKAKDYSNLHYKYYTYVGDSISWGFGLHPDVDPLSADYVFARLEGAFTDIVGKVLEQNCGTEVHSAASTGGRLCDFRMLLERGMGVEDPYTCPDDTFGNRAFERTKALQAGGEYVCENLKKSDLITVDLGMNDLASAAINAALSLDFIDMEKINNLSDLQSIVDYLVFALDAAVKEGDILGDLLRAFDQNFAQLRENAREVLKDIVTLAPDDADIFLLGYFIPFDHFRVIPGTERSVIMEFLGTTFASLNDFFEDIASEYSNVYYVDVPDADPFFEDGTTLTDVIGLATQDIDSVLLGIHPNADGHKYIAEKVLDAFLEINTCHHVHTKNICETVKSASGFGYISSTVCTDCGKILDAGQIITPVGNIHVPVRTVTYTVTTVVSLVSTAANKLFSSVYSLFK